MTKVPQSPSTTKLFSEISDLLRKKFNPKAIILYGSSTYLDWDESKDIDIFIVNNIKGTLNRQFISLDFQSKEIEIDCIGEMAFFSFFDKYYWYNVNLASELGKFQYAKCLFSNNKKINIYLDKLKNPSLEIRLFIISYHLGTLLYKKASYKRDLGKRYSVMYEWSIISVLCSLWNNYLPSMNEKRILNLCNHNQRKIIKKFIDPKILRNREIWDEFISYITHELSQIIKNNSPLPEIKLFFPENVSGYIELSKKIPQLKPIRLFKDRS